MNFIYKILTKRYFLKRIGAYSQLTLGEWEWEPAFKRCKVVPGLDWHTRGKNLPCVQKGCLARVSNACLVTRVTHLISQPVVLTPYVFYAPRSPSGRGRAVGRRSPQRQQLLRALPGLCPRGRAPAARWAPSPCERWPRACAAGLCSLNAPFVSLAVVQAPESWASDQRILSKVLLLC